MAGTNEITGFRARGHINLARMKRMGVTDHEKNKLIGYLAGCELLELALDALEDDRQRDADRRERERGPIEGQTVIELPGRPVMTDAA